MRKNGKTRVLFLEDDAELQELVCSYYGPRGYEIIHYGDPTIPLNELQSARDPNEVFDLVLTDLRMPRMDGMEFIKRMRQLAPKIPIILMTAHSSVEVAMEAIAAGAYDFVVKPLHFPQLNISMERALQLRRIEVENQQLRTQVKSSASFGGVIGKSRAMTAVFDLAKRVASSTATVLITGESGTGKEVVARAIHQAGNRKDGPFVAINCSAIPENLLESELFGYVKGAFTGAIDKKIGLFEEAEGGILFLDEIGDLNLSLQAKLLRVIQERKIKRIGENIFRPIDVRLLVATHKDLSKEVHEGRFREDLFFRLNVIPIKIPPLRERTEDIVPLAEHFVSKFSVQNDSVARTISRQALDHLLKMPWRGNVRELENAIERAVVLSQDREIGVKDLIPFESSPENGRISDTQGLLGEVVRRVDLPTLDEFILEYVDLVLGRVRGVKEQAARILKIDRKTLYRRIDELERARGHTITRQTATKTGPVKVVEGGGEEEPQSMGPPPTAALTPVPTHHGHHNGH